MSKKYNDAEETSYTEPRYINANILIDLATHEGAYGYVDVHDIYNTPTADVVETGKITSVITHLRSNRDSNLTRYTSNEGKESHIIISQKDRGYFQALDDIEEALLKKEKTDEAEHISQPINTEK